MPKNHHRNKNKTLDIYRFVEWTSLIIAISERKKEIERERDTEKLKLVVTMHLKRNTRHSFRRQRPNVYTSWQIVCSKEERATERFQKTFRRLLYHVHVSTRMYRTCRVFLSLLVLSNAGNDDDQVRYICLACISAYSKLICTQISWLTFVWHETYVRPSNHCHCWLSHIFNVASS